MNTTPTHPTTHHTRQQYLDGDVTHREYYAQFITPEMVRDVKTHISVAVIKASKNEHFDDIPIKKWDALSGCVFQCGQLVRRPMIPKSLADRVRAVGDGVSPSTLICIYKEIARQIQENKI